MREREQRRSRSMSRSRSRSPRRRSDDREDRRYRSSRRRRSRSRSPRRSRREDNNDSHRRHRRHSPEDDNDLKRRQFPTPPPPAVETKPNRAIITDGASAQQASHLKYGLNAGAGGELPNEAEAAAAAIRERERLERRREAAAKEAEERRRRDEEQRRIEKGSAAAGYRPGTLTEEERLRALEYPLPTTIQINAFEAVNAILLSDTSRGIAGNGGGDDTLEERLRSQTPRNMGVVISGSTGSGKTLAYLVPTLSTLSQTLFTRQRRRIKDEEDVDDLMGDLIDRVMVQTSPSVRGQGYDQVVGGRGGVSPPPRRRCRASARAARTSRVPWRSSSCPLGSWGCRSPLCSSSWWAGIRRRRPWSGAGGRICFG